MWTRLASKPQRSTCLCLLSARNKGLHQHTQFLSYLFFAVQNGDPATQISLNEKQCYPWQDFVEIRQNYFQLRNTNHLTKNHWENPWEIMCWYLSHFLTTYKLYIHTHTTLGEPMRSHALMAFTLFNHIQTVHIHTTHIHIFTHIHTTHIHTHHSYTHIHTHFYHCYWQ